MYIDRDILLTTNSDFSLICASLRQRFYMQLNGQALPRKSCCYDSVFAILRSLFRIRKHLVRDSEVRTSNKPLRIKAKGREIKYSLPPSVRLTCHLLDRDVDLLAVQCNLLAVDGDLAVQCQGGRDLDGSLARATGGRGDGKGLLDHQHLTVLLLVFLHTARTRVELTQTNTHV